MRKRYSWTLVGPWYRRESVGGPPGRSERPIIQKYAFPDFVTEFLKEPQHSLKFVCEDFVNRICLNDIYEPVTPGNRQNGAQLKLFLDTHSRFYMVVCELHCVAPGRPSVLRDQVCEAGFVVRRYTSTITEEGRQQLYRVMAERNHILVKIRKLLPKKQMQAATSSKLIENLHKWLAEADESLRREKLVALKEEFERKTEELQALSYQYDVNLSLQRWVPGEKNKSVGSWHTIGDTSDMTPQAIEEEIYPLYPLIPDPADKDHSAFGKTIWFGVVPTYSGDVDENGSPKFDNESAYEIRCYVRRHKEGCPKKPTRGDCHGEIVWSKATETYKLAPYFDLDGTGHKPVNIQLPDINALKDQAMRGPMGKGVNVRMNAPVDSALNFASKGMDMPDSGWPGSEICFFCIPLITLVALFVFRLFLPILVWLFGLWFLLRLRFCIPPSFSFDAGLAADLKAFGPAFEAEIDAEITLNDSVTLGGTVYKDIKDLKEDIKDKLGAEPSIPDFMKDDFKAQLDTDFDGTVGLIVDMTTDFSDEPDIEELAGKIPLPEDGLIYFEKVPLL